MSENRDRQGMQEAIASHPETTNLEKAHHLGEALIELIGNQYDLPDLRFLQKVDQGYLSDNYILESGDQKFFLKKHRTPDREVVRTTLDVEQFYAQHDIPAILPVHSKDSTDMFEFDGRVFSLYPHVAGRHGDSKKYTPKALQSSAEMLARMHIAGQKDYPKVAYDDYGIWPKESFLEKAKELKEKIVPASEFDKLAMEFLELLISLVEQSDDIPSIEEFGSKQLIHGDYHGANLFFDENDEVTHIFDFEKAQIQPSIVEVARSVNFFCFGGEFPDEQYDNAAHFLKSYESIIPLDKDLLRKALKFWYYRQVHSLWLHTEHYEKGNTRIDPLFQRRYNNLKFLSENIDPHLDKIMERIM